MIHIWGGQGNIDIENNIIWHAQSRAQTILIEEGSTDNVRIKNNLDVEDPSNFTNWNIYAMGWDVNHAHGETIQNNTAVYPYWGTSDGVLYEASHGDDPSTHRQTIESNIVGPNARSSGGDANFKTSCANGCVSDHNVSGDGSAAGSGSIRNWRLNWQTTSWTPNAGSPWRPPPPNYYKPRGIPSSIGYQRTIGP